ncbi:hypothetical protein ACFV0C_24850 [Streptomyces sp. NPDC059568]|uniref:hypothetical protein n=1 Tax=Streptomyces sp. NPDC059568 TaxID=3346868 RepID=UPI0036B58A24
MCPDQDEQLRRATAALAAAGLAPKPPVSCGEHNRQGGGTYHVIEFGESEVFISTLGRLAAGTDTDFTARQTLESAGFRWIDGTTGAIRVTDLCVWLTGRGRAWRVVAGPSVSRCGTYRCR